jgi:hypothetical protein
MHDATVIALPGTRWDVFAHALGDTLCLGWVKPDGAAVGGTGLTPQDARVLAAQLIAAAQEAEGHRGTKAWLEAEADDDYLVYREPAFHWLSRFMKYLAAYGVTGATLRLTWDGRALEMEIADAIVEEVAS